MARPATSKSTLGFSGVDFMRVPLPAASRMAARFAIRWTDYIGDGGFPPQREIRWRFSFFTILTLRRSGSTPRKTKHPKSGGNPHGQRQQGNPHRKLRLEIA